MPVNLASIVTLTRVRLYEGQPGTTVATVYTVPAATDVAVKTILLCNTTATAATVTLYLQPLGVAAAPGNTIISAQPIAGNATTVVDFPQGLMLTATDVLGGLQGTGGAITVVISGETYA